MKLKPRKCTLFRTEVKVLGKLVSRERISLDPDKIEAVKCWPNPTSVTEVESFQGFANYHRAHIKHYAEVANPLCQLTGSKARKVKFQWVEDHQLDFDHIKSLLISAPVLGFPKPEGRFVLDTDALESAIGMIGAELIQIQNGEEVVLSYGSCTLTLAQRRYCTTQKELLAVAKFTRQYKHYLLGGELWLEPTIIAWRG